MTAGDNRLSSLPIDISQITRANLLTSLEAVRGCLKTTSMLWMHALGLPVLDGVVVGDWSRHSSRFVSHFCAKHQLTSVLLRIDKRDQRWTKRRGGYLVGRDRIRDIVEELARERMISVLLEPASPYKDEYSLSAVTNPDKGSILIEVVGPGFDASDILRGDIGAHERLEAPLHGGSSEQYTRSFIVAPEPYTKTVSARLGKIGARLENPAFPADSQARSEDERRKLVESAISLLRKSRQTLLLDNSESYKPIAPKHVSKFLAQVRRLLLGLAAYGIHLGPTSISASYIKGFGLIFWDFFPAKKQEAASLYPR